MVPAAGHVTLQKTDEGCWRSGLLNLGDLHESHTRDHCRTWSGYLVAVRRDSVAHASAAFDSSIQRLLLPPGLLGKLVSDEHVQKAAIDEEAVPTDLVAAQDVDVDELVQP